MKKANDSTTSKRSKHSTALPYISPSRQADSEDNNHKKDDDNMLNRSFSNNISKAMKCCLITKINKMKKTLTIT